MQDVMSGFVCSGNPPLFRRKLTATNATRINEDDSIFAAVAVWIQAAAQRTAWAWDFFFVEIAILGGKPASSRENSFDRYRQFDIIPLHCSAIFIQDAF